MQVVTHFKKHFYHVLLLVTGIVLAYLAYYNEIWEGGGDNYWHYYFSKYSYKFPKFFFHHWGKPFFILLSGPFSQFGFWGLNLFNILCGLASATVCYFYCRELRFNSPWLVVIILLFAPIYFLILQSAMTEPLFSLVLILSSYLLHKEKYLAGAIVASAIMYCRTEGTFILLIYAGYLMAARSWKYIPFLGTAFLLYSITGFLNGHDFFWYFTENPYPLDGSYGRGAWTTFIEKYGVILGIPHVILLFGGIAILFYQIIKNQEYRMKKPLQENMKVFILLLVPTVSFSFFHIYAWAMARFGSAGLERVFTCIVPCTSILCMYSLSLINTPNYNRYIRATVNVTVCFFIIQATFRYYQYPLKAWGPEKVEAEAATWFKNVRKPGYTVYYLHPAILFFCDYDPFSPENKESFGFPTDCNFKDKGPFYFVWDSQFSPSVIQLVNLKECPNVKLLKSFEEDGYFKLYFFEYNPPILSEADRRN